MTDKQLTLVEHLAEFRRRFIVCLVSIFLSSILCYIVIERISDFLVRPAGKLVFITPQEVFVTYLKLSFIAGIFLALPVILYQIWCFVSMGLKQNENKYLLLYGSLSFILFLGGALFAYFLVLPLGLKFLLGFATDTLQPMISFNNYVSFAGTFLLMFGVVFELPLVIMFLTKINLVSPKLLREKRKYSILLIFIVAAILTPGPDVISQILMAVPLMVLYEIGILLSKFVSPLKEKREPE